MNENEYLSAEPLCWGMFKPEMIIFFKSVPKREVMKNPYKKMEIIEQSPIQYEEEVV